MKIENGKIIEATKKELLALYLDREMDLAMGFQEYVAAMQKNGCKVVDGGAENATEETALST